MSLDTRNSIIAIIAAATMAALLVISLIGILILAAAHDGELANHALDTFNQIIIVVVPAMAALAGVERVVTGLTASKTVAANAAVQVAQATSPTAATVAEPGSSLAGTSPEAVAADAAVSGAGV